MIWTQDIINKLRNLWDEGHPTAEIARRLNLSKNAVVGKAHRLELEARPSPIRREGAPKLYVRSAPKQTLPRLQSDVPQPTHPVFRLPIPERKIQVTPEPAPPPQVISMAPRRPPSKRQCQWPIGHPGTKGFRFCDAAADIGRSYCGDHCQRAYVRIRDRRDDAYAATGD
jgi:GcrA cell cycle regulator